MEQTMTKYTIVSPAGICIKGIQAGNIIGLHSLLKREGCAESENLFTDEQKAIALDDVQICKAQANKTDVKPSTDILLCIYKNKIFLAEAKFRVENVRNVSKREIEEKIVGSRDLVEDENFHIVPPLFLLFSSTVLTPKCKQARINELKKIFLSSPNYQFMTAAEFYNLFEH